MIDSKGQPINKRIYQLDSDINNITWMTNNDNNQVKIMVTRSEKLLSFFK